MKTFLSGEPCGGPQASHLRNLGGRQMKNCVRGACRHFCVFVLAGAVASPAFAEEQLQEIVVTAQK
jgi:hypothetical protein